MAIYLSIALLATAVLEAGASGGRVQHVFVPQRALDVVRQQENGMDSVTFTLKTPYPAASTLTQVRSSVENKGWKPLNEDFLNPGLPSAHVGGWGTVVDGTATPNETLHVWHAQWVNPAGDILFYHLEYRCPLGDQEHSSVMRVAAAFVPRTVYDRMKREMKEIDRHDGAAEQ